MRTPGCFVANISDELYMPILNVGPQQPSLHRKTLIVSRLSTINPDRPSQILTQAGTSPALTRFEELRDSKLKVARAWAIKELFDDFWSFEFLADAKDFFKDWYRWATHCRLKPVIQVAKRLKKHWNGLQGYILHPISNATAEGFNSKIQNIKASARGFRNFDNFRYAILFYCGKLDLIPARFNFPQKS